MKCFVNARFTRLTGAVALFGGLFYCVAHWPARTTTMVGSCAIAAVGFVLAAAIVLATREIAGGLEAATPPCNAQ